MSASLLHRVTWIALLTSVACGNAGVGNGDCDGGCVRRLSWIAPTTNADGTPLVDLAGYKLHYDGVGRGGQAGHVYANVVDIGMPSCAPRPEGGDECQLDLPALEGPAGSRTFFAVTAYDRAVPPNESAYSNEASVVK